LPAERVEFGNDAENNKNRGLPGQMSKQLARSTATIGAMTMLSRVLGFLRDMVIARIFGASAEADAFFVAFRIPNLFRRITAEGAFAQSFVPVLSEYRSQREHGEVRHLVERVAGTMLVILTLLTIVAVVAAPLVITIFAPGFLDEGDKFDLAGAMLRIVFPYIVLISLSALAGGVLNSYGRFAVPALMPVFLNTSLIGAALWLAPLLEQPIMALAWGVLVGGVLQLALQLPTLHKLGLLVWPHWGWRDSGVRQVLKLMLPAIFGASVAQINLLINTVIASFMVSGSISWLYYSDRLVELPLGVIGVALGTVILPSLSRNVAERSSEEFSRTLDWGIRWVMLMGIPATLGLMLLAGPVLATLFFHGEFTHHDLEMSRYSLVAYSSGLLSFMLVKILAPGFYARQDTRTPVRFAMVAIGVNIAFNLLVVVPMILLGLPAPHAGLALATAVAGYVNVWQLFRTLRREGVYQPQPGWGRLFRQLLLANGAMAALLLIGVPGLEQWADWGNAERALNLGMWISAALLLYGVVLRFCGVNLLSLLDRRKQV
jgi:putative peptidoglycan lipid II flippase